MSFKEQWSQNTENSQFSWTQEVQMLSKRRILPPTLLSYIGKAPDVSTLPKPKQPGTSNAAKDKNIENLSNKAQNPSSNNFNINMAGNEKPSKSLLQNVSCAQRNNENPRKSRRNNDKISSLENINEEPMDILMNEDFSGQNVSQKISKHVQGSLNGNPTVQHTTSPKRPNRASTRISSQTESNVVSKDDHIHKASRLNADNSKDRAIPSVHKEKHDIVPTNIVPNMEKQSISKTSNGNQTIQHTTSPKRLNRASTRISSQTQSNVVSEDCDYINNAKKVCASSGEVSSGGIRPNVHKDKHDIVPTNIVPNIEKQRLAKTSNGNQTIQHTPPPQRLKRASTRSSSQTESNVVSKDDHIHKASRVNTDNSKNRTIPSVHKDKHDVAPTNIVPNLEKQTMSKTSNGNQTDQHTTSPKRPNRASTRINSQTQSYVVSEDSDYINNAKNVCASSGDVSSGRIRPSVHKDKHDIVPTNIVPNVEKQRMSKTSNGNQTVQHPPPPQRSNRASKRSSSQTQSNAVSKANNHISNENRDSASNGDNSSVEIRPSGVPKDKPDMVPTNIVPNMEMQRTPKTNPLSRLNAARNKADNIIENKAETEDIRAVNKVLSKMTGILSPEAYEKNPIYLNGEILKSKSPVSTPKSVTLTKKGDISLFKEDLKVTRSVRKKLKSCKVLIQKYNVTEKLYKTSTSKPDESESLFDSESLSVEEDVESISTNGYPESMDSMAETITESVDSICETITESVDSIGETITESVDSIGETITESVDSMGETISESVDNMGETITESESLEIKSKRKRSDSPQEIDKTKRSKHTIKEFPCTSRENDIKESSKGEDKMAAKSNPNNNKHVHFASPVSCVPTRNKASRFTRSVSSTSTNNDNSSSVQRYGPVKNATITKTSDAVFEISFDEDPFETSQDKTADEAYLKALKAILGNETNPNSPKLDTRNSTKINLQHKSVQHQENVLIDTSITERLQTTENDNTTKLNNFLRPQIPDEPIDSLPLDEFGENSHDDTLTEQSWDEQEMDITPTKPIKPYKSKLPKKSFSSKYLTKKIVKDTPSDEAPIDEQICSNKYKITEQNGSVNFKNLIKSASQQKMAKNGLPWSLLGSSQSSTSSQQNKIFQSRNIDLNEELRRALNLPNNAKVLVVKAPMQSLPLSNSSLQSLPVFQNAISSLQSTQSQPQSINSSTEQTLNIENNNNQTTDMNKTTNADVNSNTTKEEKKEKLKRALTLNPTLEYEIEEDENQNKRRVYNKITRKNSDSESNDVITDDTIVECLMSLPGGISDDDTSQASIFSNHSTKENSSQKGMTKSPKFNLREMLRANTLEGENYDESSQETVASVASHKSISQHEEVNDLKLKHMSKETTLEKTYKENTKAPCNNQQSQLEKAESSKFNLTENLKQNNSLQNKENDHQSNQESNTHQSNQESNTHQSNQESNTHQSNQESNIHQNNQESNTHQSNQESSTHQSNQESNTHQNNQESNTHQSNQESNTHQSNQESNTPQSNHESNTHQSNQESNTPQSNQESNTHQSNQESNTHQNNQESNTHQSNQESNTPQSNQESNTPQSNQESNTHQSNQESNTPQSNQESNTHQSNQESNTHQSNQEGNTPQSNQESNTPQSNQEGNTPQSHQESNNQNSTTVSENIQESSSSVNDQTNRQKFKEMLRANTLENEFEESEQESFRNDTNTENPNEEQLTKTNNKTNLNNDYNDGIPHGDMEDNMNTGEDMDCFVDSVNILENKWTIVNDPFPKVEEDIIEADSVDELFRDATCTGNTEQTQTHKKQDVTSMSNPGQTQTNEKQDVTCMSNPEQTQTNEISRHDVTGISNPEQTQTHAIPKQDVTSVSNSGQTKTNEMSRHDVTGTSNAEQTQTHPIPKQAATKEVSLVSINQKSIKDVDSSQSNENRHCLTFTNNQTSSNDGGEQSHSSVGKSNVSHQNISKNTDKLVTPLLIKPDSLNTYKSPSMDVDDHASQSYSGAQNQNNVGESVEDIMAIFNIRNVVSNQNEKTVVERHHNIIPKVCSQISTFDPNFEENSPEVVCGAFPNLPSESNSDLYSQKNQPSILDTNQQEKRSGTNSDLYSQKNQPSILDTNQQETRSGNNSDLYSQESQPSILDTKQQEKRSGAINDLYSQESQPSILDANQKEKTSHSNGDMYSQESQQSILDTHQREKESYTTIQADKLKNIQFSADAMELDTDFHSQFSAPINRTGFAGKIDTKPTTEIIEKQFNSKEICDEIKHQLQEIMEEDVAEASTQLNKVEEEIQSRRIVLKSVQEQVNQLSMKMDNVTEVKHKQIFRVECQLKEAKDELKKFPWKILMDKAKDMEKTFEQKEKELKVLERKVNTAKGSLGYYLSEEGIKKLTKQNEALEKTIKENRAKLDALKYCIEETENNPKPQNSSGRDGYNVMYTNISELLEKSFLPQSIARRANNPTTRVMINDKENIDRKMRITETKKVLEYIHGSKEAALYGAVDYLVNHGTVSVMRDLAILFKKAQEERQSELSDKDEPKEMKLDGFIQDRRRKYNQYMPKRKYKFLCKLHTAVSNGVENDEFSSIQRISNTTLREGSSLNMNNLESSIEHLNKFFGPQFQIPKILGVSRTVTGLALMIANSLTRVSNLEQQLIWLDDLPNHFVFQFSDEGGPEDRQLQLAMSIGVLTCWNLGGRRHSPEHQYMLHGFTVSEKERTALMTDIWKQHTDEMLVMEGCVFTIQGKKATFSFEPAADMTWHSWAANDTNQLTKFPSVYANVTSDNIAVASGYLGLEHRATWKPYTYNERMQNAKSLQCFLKELDKNMPMAERLLRRKEYMMSKGVRQLGQPRISNFVEKLRPEPSQCEVAIMTHILNLLIRESLNRRKVHEMAAVLSAEVGGHSQSTDSSTDNSAADRYGFTYGSKKCIPIKAGTKGCGLPHIGKLLYAQCTSLPKGEESGNFKVTLTLADAISVSQNWHILVDNLNCPKETEHQKIVRFAFGKIGEYMREALDLIYSTQTNCAGVERVHHLLKMVYNIILLFVGRRFVNTAVWTMCQALPYHMKKLYDQYRTGYGMVSGQTRSATLNCIRDDLKVVKDIQPSKLGRGRWWQVSRLNFARCFYLTENEYLPYPADVHTQRNPTPADTNTCQCGRKKTKEENDIVCIICDDRLIMAIVQAAITGKSNQDVKEPIDLAEAADIESQTPL